MLFAGGERQDIPSLAARVDSFTDKTARHFMNIRFLRGEESEIRSTVPEWNSKGLRFTYDNIRTHFAASLDHEQRGGVCDNAGQRAFCMCVFDEFCVIIDSAEEIGILHDDQHGVVVN